MRDERSHLRRASLAALIALSISAGTAAAQSCGGESDRLARQYDLSADAPRAGTTEAPAAPGTPPSGGATATESRAQSSGVLSPPDVAAPTAHTAAELRRRSPAIATRRSDDSKWRGRAAAGGRAPAHGAAAAAGGGRGARRQ